jgi:phospholipid/cholesterol/gamma-HCH transport system ATP-binding protein
MEGELAGLPAMKPQIAVSPGVPERKAVARRQRRVGEMLPGLPENAQRAIRDSVQTAASGR